MRPARPPVLVPVLAAALVLAACASSEPVVVGSLDDRESALVAELYVQLLEGNGIDAELRPRVGTRAQVVDALEDGDIDVYPEYSGDGLDFLAGRSEATPEVSATASGLRRRFSRRGIRVFDPSGASRQLVAVVTFETAERTRIFTVSGLAGLDEPVGLGVPPGCADQPRCLPGLRSLYGLEPADVTVLEDGRSALQALHEGQVDAVLIPATEGALAGADDVVLVDDRMLQPAQNVLPVVRGPAYERQPDMYRVFDLLSEELTTADLRELDRRASLDGEDPAEVARDILADKGLVAED